MSKIAPASRTRLTDDPPAKILAAGLLAAAAVSALGLAPTVLGPSGAPQALSLWIVMVLVAIAGAAMLLVLAPAIRVEVDREAACIRVTRVWGPVTRSRTFPFEAAAHEAEGRAGEAAGRLPLLLSAGPAHPPQLAPAVDRARVEAAIAAAREAMKAY